MSCESFHDALIEAAASGEEPRGELRAHLKECAACRGAFEQEQALFAAMDSGLRSVANAKVPPSLLPRVRAAIDEAPAPAPAWSPMWFVLAGASAMLAIVFVAQTIWHQSVPPRPVETAGNTNHPSSSGPLVQSPGAVTAMNPGSVVPRAPASMESVHTPRGGSKTGRQPEVLVPRDQEVLLASYAEEWAHKKVAPVLRADSSANEPQFAPLEVAPIQIAELDVKLLAESDAQ